MILSNVGAATAPTAAAFRRYLVAARSADGRPGRFIVFAATDAVPPSAVASTAHRGDDIVHAIDTVVAPRP